ncbi:hypothetical protein [Alienimonas californiensis]|uniref:Uncharacterized protein n=1 Tax=Alienimonas californiensis TaxID=2527989 RepID=A0A517P8Y7_9PLAN|nr:hypothetical protein [Alienimonas californiensis]QDT15831.1 hypothetical protein CA12_19260 [Alienimonas californiensis]
MMNEPIIPAAPADAASPLDFASAPDATVPSDAPATAPGAGLPDAAAASAPDAPGLGAFAGLRARAERRALLANQDRRKGGPKPPTVPVERRRRDRRSGARRTLGLELSANGLSLAVTIRDGAAPAGGAPASSEHADPHRKDAKFYGPAGFERFTAGSRTVCRFRPWPPGCGPTEPGYTREVLAEAFAAATAALGSAGHSLSGAPVDVALGGSLCVTRVLTVTNEEAGREAAALADRAGRYLGLGRGEKTCVTAEERLDAKTRRVRVTVAPRQVAADVLRVLSDAGLRAGRIEHTLAVLSAGLHARGLDGDRPVLLLAAEGDRLDVAVAHRGRLLLDYRPVGSRTAADVDEATAAGALGDEALLRHQKRIRRYVANQLRGQPGGAQFFADADAADNAATGHAAEMRTYVTGGAAVTSRLSAELDPRPDLAVGPHPAPAGVDFAASAPPDGGSAGGTAVVWSVGAAVSPGPLAAVLLACGAAAGLEDAGALSARGDLSAAVRPGGGVPWKDLARVGWPVAAALALTVGLWGAAWRSNTGLSSLENAVNLAKTDADMASWLRGKLIDAEELKRRAARLAQTRGTGPVWVPALAGAGSALVERDGGTSGGGAAPRRAWLEAFTVGPAAGPVDSGSAAADGTAAVEVDVIGGGHTDADVFAFADRLRRSGRFVQVKLAATREARYRTGPGVRFELTAAPVAEATGAAAAVAARPAVSPPPAAPRTADGSAVRR